jgi:tRNA(adenine34) deaminase
MGSKDDDRRFMGIALGHAEKALDNGWIPVGAVFVKDSQVVAYGIKNGITHSLFDHAEHNGCYQALWSRKGPRNLQGFTVYTTLEPCVMCMSLLMTTRVTRIVYGLRDPYGGGEFMLDGARLPARFRKERPVLEGGVLREESRALLRKFFLEQKRKKNGRHQHWSDEGNPLVRLAMRK